MVRSLISTLIALAVTLAVFLVLPVLQTISKPPARDLIVSNAGFGNEPPPPPPIVEEEPPPEKDSEEAPPELEPETQPLDLQQLELALNPGLGGAAEGVFGSIQARLTGQIDQATGNGAGDMGGVFSLADLDQRPRAIFQVPPQYPAELRRRGVAGTVTIVFTVDVNGRVANLKVEKSTDPLFESPALEAVRQWRFEPGTRKGQPVPFRMRAPITFNASA